MRNERDAVVVDMRQPLFTLGDDVVGLDAVGVHREHLAEPGTQRQHLEAAAVGERRARPVHEGTQATRLVDDVRAGLQVEVVGVGQHSLGAQLTHRLRQHRLDRGLGADRDERRGGVDVAVRSVDHAGTSTAPGQLGVDGEERHPAI